ncbi:MAG: hypothetical protein L3J39_17505 [Verrucomicrobiales bacterium]|nr:hypothetical protein [Verrucomicrobiales bacterium]
MDYSEKSQDPYAVAEHLYVIFSSENFERLDAESVRVLAGDPDNDVAHYYRAIALINLERLDEAWQHVEFLQKNEPDDNDTNLVSAMFYLARRNWTKVGEFAQEGLRQEPDNDLFHYHAALAALGKLKVDLAKKHIDQARDLDPEDVDYAHLAIQIQGLYESSAKEAWLRIEDFKSALNLDPQNASLHHSIGDVYFDELDDPKEAEAFYREAVRLNPKNRRFQRSLFHASAKRDFIYRVLSIPSRAMGWLVGALATIRIQPWRLFIGLFLFKAVIAFLVWLTLVIIVFWPAAKIYEWLLVSELKKGAQTSIRELKVRSWFNRWHRGLRFSLYLLLIAGFQAAIIHYLMGMDLMDGFVVLSIFIAVHALVVAVLMGIDRMRVYFAKRGLRKTGRLS